jgi:tRNA threonylcarbamoyladenosine biosynthesis protein TsaB
VIILSLDTTTRDGSAAVVRENVVIAELSGDPALTHGQRLPGELQRVLDRAGVGIDQVDLFAVAAGPGSFTGLRVGIATVQGLAMASGRAVVPVSALDALARAGANAHAPVAVWMDAQRSDVFAALYSPDGRQLLVPPVSSAPRAVLDAWQTAGDVRSAVFIGDGAVRYRDFVGEARVIPPPPLAGVIGRMAAEDPSRAVQPHAIVPIYVRRPDAELARARRAIAD